MSKKAPSEESTALDDALVRELLRYFAVVEPTDMQRSAALTLVRALEGSGGRSLGGVGKRH